MAAVAFHQTPNDGERCARLIGVTEVFRSVLRYIHGQVEADFVGHGQRAHRQACMFGSVFDERRLHALRQQRDAFVHHGAKEAAGEEAAAVVHDDGGLAQLLHQIQRLSQRGITGDFAANDLNQRHAVHGREEMQADEAVWPHGYFRQTRDR